MLSPLLGFVFGSIMMVLVSWMFVRSTPRRVDKWFRRLQLVSASMYSLGHGGNDAQKTMGIIWMLLIAAGVTDVRASTLPLWVVICCYLAISLGTLFGGWRIVKTMGQKITKLKPVGGFCAETGGAITLFLATALGIPVSTTHTITGAIVGVGAAQENVGGALGRGRQYRLGVDLDDSGVGVHGGDRLVDRNQDFVRQPDQHVHRCYATALTSASPHSPQGRRACASMQR